MTMKPPTRIPTRHLARAFAAPPAVRALTALPAATRAIHHSGAREADVAPVVGTGPPPAPPVPESKTAELDERVARRRRQAEMLKRARELRGKPVGGAAAKKSPALLKRRFWDDVFVREVDGIAPFSIVFLFLLF